jgi:hypothetical protein
MDAQVGTAGSYAYFGGAGLPAAPYSSKGAHLWAFLVKGDKSAIEDFLARSLNAVGGAGRFVPVLGEYVFLLRLDAGTLSSMVPEFARFGGMAEQDIGFWILVRDTVANEMYWYPAYLYVDNWLAFAAGREVWGFPKTMAGIDMSGDAMRIATLAAKIFAPETMWAEAEIFNVAPLPTEGPLVSDVVDGLVEGVLGVLGQEPGPVLWAAEAVGKLIEMMPHGPGLLPGFGGMVFLKQIRDPASSTGTTTQNIVAMMPGLLGLPTAAGRLSGPCTLTLGDYASQPISHDLGLAVGAQDAYPLMWVSFSFSITLGSVVV